MPATLLLCGGPLDGATFTWAGTLDDMPGWFGGGWDLNPNNPEKRWIYIRRCNISLKLIDEVIEYRYSPQLSATLHLGEPPP